jgi:hypothetical protein
MFCAVREENMDAQYNRLEAKWGQAAHFTEHEISDLVRYSIEGQVRTGTIIWTCAPAQGQSLRYVIQHEGANEQPDIVCPGKVIADDAQRHEDNCDPSCGIPEQTLLRLLATLSTPIIIQTDIDDDGQLYYIWQIGESTKECPWGRYVGTHRQLLGAIKLALEKVMR